MPPKPPTLYDVRKTTIWFAIASVILLIGLVMMVFQDSAREWKHWQRKFIEYQREMTEVELEKTEKALDREKIEELKADLEEVKTMKRTHQNEIKELQDKLDVVNLDLTKAKTLHQDLKQLQDSDRYFFEEHRRHHKDEKAASYGKRLEEREPRLVAAELATEFLEAEKEKLESSIGEFAKAEEEIQRTMDRMTEGTQALAKKVKKLTPDWIFAILNAPMLDFMKPPLQIQQIVLENLHDDYYFAKVQKVDRCITCHLGVDQKGFEDAPAPFQTHPRLDLFLSSNSPHPMEEFGCTSCHGGSGHSASFVTAAHTPQNEEQAKAWKKEHHWKPKKKKRYPDSPLFETVKS